MKIARAAAEAFADKVMESIPIKHRFMTEGELRQEIRQEIHDTFLPDDVAAMRKKYPNAFFNGDGFSISVLMRYKGNDKGWIDSTCYTSYISCDIDKVEAKRYIEQLYIKPQQLGFKEFCERKEMRAKLIETVVGLVTWKKVREVMPELAAFIPEPKQKKHLPAEQVSGMVNSLLNAGLKVGAA